MMNCPVKDAPCLLHARVCHLRMRALRVWLVVYYLQLVLLTLLTMYHIILTSFIMYTIVYEIPQMQSR